MRLDFRLTAGWHAPIIAFGPATVAPLSSAARARAAVSSGDPSLRSHMAAPERSDKVERIEDRMDKERGKAV
jgi:hypothetical protein